MFKYAYNIRTLLTFVICNSRQCEITDDITCVHFSKRYYHFFFHCVSYVCRREATPSYCLLFTIQFQKILFTFHSSANLSLQNSIWIILFKKKYIYIHLSIRRCKIKQMTYLPINSMKIIFRTSIGSFSKVLFWFKIYDMVWNIYANVKFKLAFFKTLSRLWIIDKYKMHQITRK